MPRRRRLAAAEVEEPVPAPQPNIDRRRTLYLEDLIFVLFLYLFAFTARDVLFHVGHTSYCGPHNDMTCRTWFYMIELVFYFIIVILAWVFLVDTPRHWRG